MAVKNLPDDWKGHDDGTPRIVEAGMAAVGQGRLGPSGKELVARIEQAMSDAIIEATEKDGLSLGKPEDSDAIRQKMLDARQRVLDEAYAPPPPPAA